jgi:hypothetical protein
VPPFWDNPAEILDAAYQQWRLDRTEGQPFTLCLGVEKRGIVQQLSAWFGNETGMPILPLGGYEGVDFENKVVELVRRYERPCVVLYAGDFDPSGEDIVRNFQHQLNALTSLVSVRRVALTSAQVDEYALPEMLGKTTDSRANGFTARHGRLCQVELDALSPDILRGF